MGLARGQESIGFLFFWEFERFQEFGLFQEFCEILQKSRGPVISAYGLAADRSLGSKKNCIAYSFVCIFIIIIIIIIVSNSISISIYLSS